MTKILERPILYKNTEVAFWNDEHISKQMLKTHLDHELEGASMRMIALSNFKSC